jgi:hypothetical protein
VEGSANKKIFAVAQTSFRGLHFGVFAAQLLATAKAGVTATLRVPLTVTLGVPIH